MKRAVGLSLVWLLLGVGMVMGQAAPPQAAWPTAGAVPDFPAGGATPSPLAEPARTNWSRTPPIDPSPFMPASLPSMSPPADRTPLGSAWEGASAGEPPLTAAGPSPYPTTQAAGGPPSWLPPTVSPEGTPPWQRPLAPGGASPPGAEAIPAPPPTAGAPAGRPAAPIVPRQPYPIGPGPGISPGPLPPTQPAPMGPLGRPIPPGSVPQAEPPIMLDTIPRPDGPAAVVAPGAVEVVAPPAVLDTIPRGMAHQGPSSVPAGAGVKADDPVPLPKIWEGSVELGISGTDGNSQTFNLRTGGKAKRKTDWNILSSQLDYRQDNAGSRQTANQALLESRYEQLFKPSPWTWFAHKLVDYNEFRIYDLRVEVDTGLGYQFLQDEWTTLTGRLGGGAMRRFGGADEDWTPQAVVGLEFEHRITKNHKLCLTVDYTPSVSDFGDFRLRGKASWEVMLDAESNLSLKLNAIDRYDSTPDGARPNDIDYSLVLLWGF